MPFLQRSSGSKSGRGLPRYWGDDSIFQYFARETPVHHLDPRTKIIWLALVTLLAVLLKAPSLLLFLFASTLVPLVIARPPLRQMMPILAFYSFIFVGTTLSQALFYQPLTGPPPEVLFWLIPPDLPVLGPFTGGVPFTLLGAVYGFIQGFRILAMLNASVTLVMTTPVNRITAGLREFRLPFTFMFMLTTAVRFVPTVIEEYRMIANALKARGLGGNPFRLARYSMAPLILNCVRRCSQLALAAESRAFGSRENRTQYTEIHFGRADAISGLIMAATTLALLVAALGNIGSIP